MFVKPYKIKSNNTLKNSEKKHLAQRIQVEFPAASDEKCKLLVPVKSTTIYMKLTAHSGDSVGVFAVDGQPMLLEVHERLVPTVCALWRMPDLVPTLTIHSPVLSKLQGGAPLYLPGVVIPAQGAGFPLFPRGTSLALNTQDNAAVCAVGFSTVGSADMLMKMSGVCLEAVQVFGDLLCKEPKFSKVERPRLGPLTHDTSISLGLPITSINLTPAPVKEEWPSLGREPARVVTRVEHEPCVIPEADPVGNNPAGNDPRAVSPGGGLDADIADLTIDDDNDDSRTEDSDVPTDMDSLLRYCLLSFLKFEGKKVELPLKTSSLYRNYLITMCPADRSLDVKKSTYKKMGKFLDAMQTEGLIEVKEVEKGVDAVVAMNVLHPMVTSHRASRPAPARRETDASERDEYTPPQIREMYCVTANVQELFAPLKKGTALTPSEVRAMLTEYVKSRNLASQRGALTLDATLARACGRTEHETAKWEEVMSGVQSRMTACTEMRFADGTLRTNKAKLEPVRMQVATRSGNKKVTLVSNLEQFGFALPELSRACQLGVAASCGVTRAPGAKHDQLMLQGDQTYFVARLLIEKYGLPKKYVEGADKALKKKNK